MSGGSCDQCLLTKGPENLLTDGLYGKRMSEGIAETSQFGGVNLLIFVSSSTQAQGSGEYQATGWAK